MIWSALAIKMDIYSFDSHMQNLTTVRQKL